jgi:proline iminopeptidase
VSSRTEKLVIEMVREDTNQGENLFRNFDVSASLKKYKGRIDIISGRQDVVGFFSYEIKIDKPSANLYWINNCGHFPMYEQPDEFYKLLYQILDTP